MSKPDERIVPVGELMKNAAMRRDDIARDRRADWRQTVTTQHTVLATLAGLQVTALTLFSAFSHGSRDVWQKLFFVLSLVSFVIIVVCLVFIAEHERKDAFDSSQVTELQRNRENKVRRTLNVITVVNALAIAALLTVSFLKG